VTLEERRARNSARQRVWRAKNRDRRRAHARTAYENRRRRQADEFRARIASDPVIAGQVPASQPSHQLQQGKAAEHLVVFDLIMQGYQAFLADQGMPFDVVVVLPSGTLQRVQVKSSGKQITTGKNHTPHYRFNLRRGVGTRSRSSAADSDVVAFVAVDARKVGYLKTVDVTSPRHGGMVTCADFYLSGQNLIGRAYPTGHVRNRWGRKLDDYATYPL
jgi:hypothetical protein